MQSARLYRLVEFIGRWSMLDIYVVTLLVALPAGRSHAQVVVFDPNNYSQSVLTAARALQRRPHLEAIAARCGDHAHRRT